MRAARLASANSFEAVGREWYLKFSATWAASHSSKVLLRLENNLYPWLGSRPISGLEADEILETLRRIEARGALETAHRCLAYCGQIFRYAIATGRARRNPAADLRGSLPPARGKHLASITNPEGIAELLQPFAAMMREWEIARDHKLHFDALKDILGTLPIAVADQIQV